LPRDAMNKHGLCHHVVADWVYVMFVYCVETAKDTAVVAMEYE